MIVPRIQIFDKNGKESPKTSMSNTLPTTPANLLARFWQFFDIGDTLTSTSLRHITCSEEDDPTEISLILEAPGIDPSNARYLQTLIDPIDIDGKKSSSGNSDNSGCATAKRLSAS